VSFGLAAYRLVDATDRFLSRLQVAIAERNGLLTLFYHSLFENEKEIDSGVINPLEQVTVAQLRTLIDYFLRNDYSIVSINDVARGLDTGKKHLLLTFDDGYFNNHRALPILKEFDATAVIFLAANHVRDGRPFWWDVLYRIRRGQGRALEEISAECARLNTQRHDVIESAVQAAAPTVPFKTVCDLDRPLKPSEVRELAATGRFYFENHTVNHAVLSAYSSDEIFQEIAGAQTAIEEMSGRKPIAIAYPNGSYSPIAAECARRAGLSLGFSTLPKKEYSGTWGDSENRMRIGRFNPFGRKSIEEQAAFFRSDVLLTQRIQAWRRAYK
jgi:peptidoglycan/xylan/chitin deacetylase (PgdA/CDA1 family)